MRHVRHAHLIGRRLRAVGLLAILLAAVTACEDELNDPETFMCDEMLEIVIEEAPVTVRYLVSADGSAVVQSVTYTTPEGEVTTTTVDHDDPNDIVFDLDVDFDEPVTAILRARGEVATGGQIGISYTIFSTGETVLGPISVCSA